MSEPASGASAGLSHWEGEPLRVWEALWRVPRIESYAFLGSTNDRVRALAALDAPGFTTVLAEEQTSGRGRGGKTWSSPPGKGLWMSVLLGPLTGEALLLAPLVVGVAVCRAIESVAPGVEALLKWPNDVLLDDRKVCGILCEAAGRDRVVAGVGVNVSQAQEDFPIEVRARAVSLTMAAGHPVSRAELVRSVLEGLQILFARPRGRLDGELALQVAHRDALLGRAVEVEGGVRGVARGIHASGALRVEVPGGDVRYVRAGSVRLAADPEQDDSQE